MVGLYCEPSEGRTCIIFISIGPVVGSVPDTWQEIKSFWNGIDFTHLNSKPKQKSQQNNPAKKSKNKHTKVSKSCVDIVPYILQDYPLTEGLESFKGSDFSGASWEIHVKTDYSTCMSICSKRQLWLLSFWPGHTFFFRY